MSFLLATSSFLKQKLDFRNQSEHEMNIWKLGPKKKNTGTKIKNMLAVLEFLPFWKRRYFYVS